MKDQTDWAFSMGINRFMFHTFAHKPYGDGLKPGVTMGPYGVHWDRNQTWWPMVSAYHKYLTRCSFILSQGSAVADILYLTPEGTPHVFRAPESTMEGTEILPDKRGYSFDGCSPLLLKNAVVHNHRIVFPGGASYRVLVLPDVQTMTPELLSQIASLVKAGATIIGNPPLKSPSLVNYPECDEQVRMLAAALWAKKQIYPAQSSEPTLDSVSGKMVSELYPPYDSTATLLKKLVVNPDFTASGSIRYIHRSQPDREIYFISNRTDRMVEDVCLFRDGTLQAELWDAVTGETRSLKNLNKTESGISISIKLEASQSFFVIFNTSNRPKSKGFTALNNFPDKHSLMTLDGSWTVAFDTLWGGPEKVIFDSLTDWTTRQEKGIRHYSGIARYSKTFDMPQTSKSFKKSGLYLNLGIVKNMARVKLNGKDLGVVWTSPWQVNISDVVKKKDNILEIEVANLWANRLIGDEALPDDGVKDNKWPDWLLKGTPRTSGRYTFTTYHFYKDNDPLIESGLMGPVKIIGD